MQWMGALLAPADLTDYDDDDEEKGWWCSSNLTAQHWLHYSFQGPTDLTGLPKERKTKAVHHQKDARHITYIYSSTFNVTCNNKFGCIGEWWDDDGKMVRECVWVQPFLLLFCRSHSLFFIFLSVFIPSRSIGSVFS